MSSIIHPLSPDFQLKFPCQIYPLLLSDLLIYFLSRSDLYNFVVVWTAGSGLTSFFSDSLASKACIAQMEALNRIMDRPAN